MTLGLDRFQIEVPQAAVDELRARLRQTRWPNGVSDSSGGFPVREAKRLAAYWSDSFDWRKQERFLNQTAQYMATVSGHGVHFIWIQSPSSGARPLMLLHGWPGSFVELLGVAEILKSDHHVVVPSIPGFGFSPAVDAPGMSNRTVAGLMVKLMSMLGYGRFGVHGGDVGAGVASWMAAMYPECITGLHLNFIPGSYAPAPAPPANEEERAFLARRGRWSDSAGAYAHVQRTRPLTLSYGLADSPAGLLCWIGEKFREWPDPKSTISDDALLTNVSIYWFTNTIASSVRIYLESSATPLTFGDGRRVDVPTAVAVFPHELPLPPRSWVERGYNVVRWTPMRAGGHFAALEQPSELARDMAEFFSTA